MSFDVFLTCAVPDADLIARLAASFSRLGYKVWLDNDLPDSEFGLAILSPDFFERSWVADERDALARPKEMTTEAFQTALAASRANPIARTLLSVWSALHCSRVYCYSPLGFEDARALPDVAPPPLETSTKMERPAVTSSIESITKGRHETVPQPPTATSHLPQTATNLASPSTRFDLLETVVLERAVPESGLRSGDIGVVVNRPTPYTLEVEFGSAEGPLIRATLGVDDINAQQLCKNCSKPLSERDHAYGPGPHSWIQSSRCGYSDPMSVEGMLTFT